ncbi:GSCOCG00000609001-RA-CDS [Cotesia congregata]|uniref:Similar to Ccdc12: Coiled-coil domain-containing protein 12 (Mus musculus) n=1 Tax=Cotesia congregata TaxID=51543 RepID=A0A8J2MPF9_COTCN|nr:GSCOCG00000609001-RA-CDS [Cotesia congregata]CAG5087421.1 Similar to Ccdc12: Coiled-coil domain-containing protein 12 (Mus musculus) [Cotesia congregata]
MSDDKVGTLTDEAVKRKQRLAELKKKNEEKNSENSNEFGNLPKPKFRSYKPQDESLKENVLEEAKPGNVESEVQDLLSAAHSKVVFEELDLTSLAPRKPDWDLKRDVSKKLEKLERRTQKAVIELIIARVKEDKRTNLAESVSAVGQM